VENGKHKAGNLWQREEDDLLAYDGNTDIYSTVSHSCFTHQNLFTPIKGLKNHLDKAKIEEDDSTPRIAAHRITIVLDD